MAGLVALPDADNSKAQKMTYWISLPDTITGPRPSFLPVYFVLFCLLWTLVLRLCPQTKSECYLSIAHSVLVTYTSLACIFRGDDTALTCAASVAFFVVDAIDMMFKDGLIGSSVKDSTSTGKPLATSRKMDYAHHVLGVTFGLVEHYYENDLCPAHVGCAFIYVQWHEISTPFYNMFRLTGQQVWGGLFALTFFLGERNCKSLCYEQMAEARARAWLDAYDRYHVLSVNSYTVSRCFIIHKSIIMQQLGL